MLKSRFPSCYFVPSSLRSLGVVVKKSVFSLDVALLDYLHPTWADKQAVL